MGENQFYDQAREERYTIWEKNFQVEISPAGDFFPACTAAGKEQREN
jgi:hypothetical protein